MKRGRNKKHHRQSSGRNLHRECSVTRRRLAMEGLEKRELLAANIVDTDIALLTGRFANREAFEAFSQVIEGRREELKDNRTAMFAARGQTASGYAGNPNGDVNSFSGRFFSENGSNNNNSFGGAQLLELGTAPGKLSEITVGGQYVPVVDGNGFSRLSDIDYYAVDLRGGDILSVRISGGDNVSLYDGEDRYRNDADLLIFSQQDQGQLSFNSQLLFGGDANYSYVIPADGRYYIGTSGVSGIYTLDMRVVRPVLEEAPAGTGQIMYLDFDGELLFPDGSIADVLTNDTLPTYLEPLEEFMPGFGYDYSNVDRMIDLILENVIDKFAKIGLHATNGFYDLSGNAGEFGITILNSRDHADVWGQPNVMRIIVGGEAADTTLGDGLLGVAQHVDYGNFDTEDTGIIFVENFIDLVADVVTNGTVSALEVASWALGSVIAHEAGHLLGLWHTVSNAFTTDIIATTYPDGLATDAGDGRDGIVGTEDDVFPQFLEGRFDTAAALVDGGYQSSRDQLAWVLSTGKVGGSITGTVYNDANRNQIRNSGEPGIAGVTVFADINNNGVLDPNEPRDVTTGAGTYSLVAAAGAVTVRIVTPAGSEATTPTSRTVTVPQNGAAAADFGLRVVNQQFTGRKWADLNGNGLPDSGEPGIEGVFVYLDLDGDDRLDLGEPQTKTDANGNYTLQFPGVGTYVIREVVAPGYLQTYPVSGEHVVSYNGTMPVTGKDFGNRPVRDYGDAPDTYGTLASSNGAVHGLVAGLNLGALVDAEADGLPSILADGDNLSGDNDEDGVVLRSPLSPGSTAAMDISVINTTGSTAYVSGWIDLNDDGDFGDAGEKFVSDLVVSASGTYRVNFAVPATAQVGATYARFRLSQSTNVSPIGFAPGGEVEDYRFQIAASPDLANADSFDVPRGSLSFPLDVLGNDFDLSTDPLLIDSVNTAGTAGQVIISSDRRSIFYTPAGNALGPDSFTYTVSNTSGTMTDTATVSLNVVFQSNVPVAVDDSFDVPEGVINQPLNVLANDIPSIYGGTRVISAGTGSSGGTVSITSGGQSVRYTPAPGFKGTEQFTYTVSDSNGNVSSAVATVHLQPGSNDDDLAAFNIEFLDATGANPINTIPAGQPFQVRVTVDDLRGLNPFQRGGLGAAYLDLLYTDGLVTTVPGSVGSGFDFGIQFGSLFSSVRTGDASVPGLIDEVGATQSLPGTTFRDPRELFTITMVAVSPGVAEFITDPADTAISDTVFLNQYDADGNEVQLTELQPKDIYFGRRQLTIVPSGSDFTFAVDDSYPDQLDSNGNLIVAGQNATLRVLENDNRGPSGEIQIVNVGAVGNGVVTVNNNGTVNNTNDDYLVYRPNPGFVGMEQFQYTILSADGVQSSAQVTLTVGDADADNLVAFDLRVKDSDGNLIGPGDSLTVGEQFSVELWVDDLRAPLFGEPRGVFAAYTDLLYNRLLAEPAPATTPTGERLGFDVFFNEAKFDKDGAVGDNYVPGLINEFGSFQTTAQGSGDPLNAEPVLLASINMIAKAPGDLRLVADPADVSPFQDTLLFEPPAPVPVSQITYDLEMVQIVSAGGGEGESPFQNGRNRWDVNNDGVVSPIDALLVLNRLNRIAGEGEDAGGSGSKPTVFWDVNGDRVITPLDALHVINYLNRRSSGGEGEATPVAPGRTDAVVAFTEAADSIFSEIGSVDDPVRSSGDDSSSNSQAARGNDMTAYCVPSSDGSDDGDDEEEGFTLGNLL